MNTPGQTRASSAIAPRNSKGERNPQHAVAISHSREEQMKRDANGSNTSPTSAHSGAHPGDLNKAVPNLTLSWLRHSEGSQMLKRQRLLKIVQEISNDRFEAEQMES